MKHIYQWGLAGLLLLSATSCKKYLNEEIISDVSYQLYTTEKGIEGALTAAYNTMRIGVMGERALTFSDAGTDLFALGSDGNPAFNQYLATLSSLEAKVSQYWDYHYKGISECNVAVTYLPKVDMNAARKIQIEAEAKFLRAYYYFDLVQHYGKIPLVLESTDKIVTSYKRAAVKDVYAAIINDLQFAYANLPIPAPAQGRANKAAAAHLMAKVYLVKASATSSTQKELRGSTATDADSVIHYAGKIVNKELGNYSLVADYAKLFDAANQVNSEVIFAVQFTPTLLNNGSGNQMHLYHVPQYDGVNTKILARSTYYGRPYRRVRPTPYVYNGLFGATRMYDSRFAKSFVWGYIANKAATGITTTAGNKIDVKVGDTALYFSPVMYGNTTDLNAAIQDNKRFAHYYPQNTYAPLSMNYIFPGLNKWLDGGRPTTNEVNGSRDWMVFRFGETLLLLAEGYGLKGDFTNAARYITQVRERAAYKEGEMKTTQYWTFEGGDYADRTKSTVDQMKVTAADISGDFTNLILEERGREMLGELNRWEDLVRCEKLVERVKLYNPDASNIREFHILRPIPQTHIDRLDPAGPMSEEQNQNYY
ncbi:RagB/SusD family nutrient uptake outer membrane protein [Chitinophaga horti]|uniref:RagB/SusD family nutrient uptake outer membrane protein n=1 Tax=Chitinophaga horti TaxID=2920382 RepID=A0ABY6IWX3_9BACT|nr:RagB/SusD family nutrient uptake outer membrane protein [Chitinophaga horti]UYQ91795.1 RagB/SusD family nutrient uptake outer membrane protein [Chitinophaga horti]